MPGLTYTLKADGTKMDKGLQNARQSVERFRRDTEKAFNVGGKGGMFGAVLGGNLVAQGATRAGRAILNAVDGAGQLIDAQDQLGVSAENLSKLERVFQGSGVSGEDLRKGMLKLIITQDEVRNGSEDAAKKMAQFGISADEAANADTLTLFLKIADGIRGITDQGKAASAVMDIFGTKNAKLIGGLKEGGASIREGMAAATGAIKTENAKALDDAVDAAEAKSSQLKDTVLDKIGGIIAGAKKGWSKYKAEQEQATNPETVVRNLGDLSEAVKEKAAEAKKASDEEIKAAEKARQQAFQEIADRKKSIDEEKRTTAASERETKALQKQADAKEDLMTVDEKLAIAKKRVSDAQSRFSVAERLFGKDSAAAHEARADLTEAQGGLAEAREAKIQRIMKGSTAANAEARAERKAVRDRRRAERILDAREKIKKQDAENRGAKPLKGDAAMNIAAPEKKDDRPVTLLDKIEKEMVKLNNKLTVA